MWSSLFKQLAILVVVACVWLGWPLGTAQAARYALLIGANQGQPGEPTLRFAVADAERMAQVLQTQGGFLSENTTVLRQPTADRVRAALGAINARIRAEASESERVLLVFYSGHADANAIHAGASQLPWNELRDLTFGSSANTRLLIVDACRSGAATRVKGVAVDKPFALPPSLGDTPDGFAVLSSAAAGESAQESDTIGSSFFTFHLTAALQGLGDRDADGVVTLAEAFDYTSERTMASTAATLAGVQHPTYRYDLKGRSSLVLTRPGAAADRLVQVNMHQAGVYLWRQEGAEGRLILEASVASRAKSVWLMPGAYFVQRRGSDRFYEAAVTLSQGQPALDTSTLKMRAVRYDQLVRKGGRTVANSVAFRAGASSPVVQGYGAANIVGLHLAQTRPEVTIDIGLETAGASLRVPNINGNLRGYTAFVGASRLADVGPVAAGLGLRAGATAVRQTFDTTRDAPERWHTVPFATMLGMASVNVPLGLFVGIEAGLTVLRFEAVANDGVPETKTRVMPWACLEMGKRF